MTTIITRVRHESLYKRLKLSALENAAGAIQWLCDYDNGSPRLAETYNLAIPGIRGDVVVFMHDDAFFTDLCWDDVLRRELKNYDIIGAVGTDLYRGNTILSEGHPHCFGKYLTEIDGKPMVKVFSRATDKPMSAVDGMFLATTHEFLMKHKFDGKLDSLFFYDIDFCLGNKCGLTSLLIGHSKPADLYGKYPDSMKPQSEYEEYFYHKHQITPRCGVGDMRCAALSPEDFALYGQDFSFKKFSDKFLGVPC